MSDFTEPMPQIASIESTEAESRSFQNRGAVA